MNPAELSFKPLDYPRERPDVDVESLLRRAEVLIASRLPRDLLGRAPRLRWLHLTSAGVDHLWNPSLDDADIVITKASMHGVPICEFVLGCMLLFAKKIDRIREQQRRHHWQKFVIEELFGKTVVIAGLGETGRAIAKRAKDFGMHVIGIRRRAGSEGPPGAVDEIVAIGELDLVARRADYVVGALPFTPRTRRVMAESMFRAMKPSALFVNVGRGGTVDQAALVRALKEGWISGAALDVYEQEPLPPDSPLWDMPNVLVSPHMATDTPMYTERSTQLFCDNLRRYASGEPLHHVVDRNERY